MIGTLKCADVTRKFLNHAVDNTTFRHAEHVRVAFDLLRQHDFIDAASLYAKGVRTIAANAGAPQKFTLTITYAFMSLIAERMVSNPDCDFDDFVTANPDLMSKDVLGKWYDSERLHTDTARSIFLMPDVL